MISADTNIFVYSCNRQAKDRDKAVAFLNEMSVREDFVLCELVLIEIYMALRNPAVFANPMTAGKAAAHCDKLRSYPVWRVVDYAPEIRKELWRRAANPDSAFRRIIDARLALTLKHHGVKEFATVNTKHFADFGFVRIWNPLQS